MTLFSAVKSRVWPLAALLLFWIAFVRRMGESSSLPELGVALGVLAVAAVSAGVYGGMSLWSAALRERPRRTRHALAGLAVALVLALGLFFEPLVPLSTAALYGLLWIAALRIAPRCTLVLWVLRLGGGGTAYFGAVLMALGFLVIPAPVSEHLRELMPRRVGKAP